MDKIKIQLIEYPINFSLYQIEDIRNKVIIHPKYEWVKNVAEWESLLKRFKIKGPFIRKWQGVLIEVMDKNDLNKVIIDHAKLISSWGVNDDGRMYNYLTSDILQTIIRKRKCYIEMRENGEFHLLNNKMIIHSYKKGS